MANGNIKRYEIVVTIIGCLVFPATYAAYKLGASILSTYFIYMAVYTLIIWIKVEFSKRLFGFPPRLFLSRVVIPAASVTLLSLVLPLCLAMFIPEGVLRLFIMVPMTFFSTTASTYIIGLTKGEKIYITNKLQSKLRFARV